MAFECSTVFAAKNTTRVTLLQPELRNCKKYKNWKKKLQSQPELQKLFNIFAKKVLKF